LGSFQHGDIILDFSCQTQALGEIKQPVIPKSRHQLLKDWTRMSGGDIIARAQAT
jgi:hypothetical protein